MKQLWIIVAIIAALAFAGSAFAADAVPAQPVDQQGSVLSNLSIDGYILYSIPEQKLSVSPGLTYNLFCALGCAVKGNIGAVVPLTNTSGISTLIAGPTIDVSLNNLVGKIPTFKWMTSKSVDFGVGVLFDIPNLTHKTVKAVTYPTLHLKIINF